MAPYRSKSLLPPTTQQERMTVLVRGSLRVSGVWQWCHVLRSLHGASRCLLMQPNDQMEVQGAVSVAMRIKSLWGPLRWLWMPLLPLRPIYMRDCFLKSLQRKPIGIVPKGLSLHLMAHKSGAYVHRYVGVLKLCRKSFTE